MSYPEGFNYNPSNAEHLSLQRDYLNKLEQTVSSGALNPDVKIISQLNLPEIRRQFENKSLVLATGVFDIVHIGHVQFLLEAKAQGDILVLGINSDVSVKKLKGKDRPIIPEDWRLHFTAAFNNVDLVFKFDEETADHHLELLRPNVYVVFEESVYPNKPEILSAQKVGSRIHIVKRFGTREVSTTAILDKLMREY